MIPPYLSQLLSDTTALESESGPLKLTVESIGSVNIPTGRIVACDATDPGFLPYARQVEPGTYPVLLTRACLQDGDECVAAAWLRFNEGVPATWQPGFWKGQREWRNPRPAYAVDSAMGAFMSLEAATVLADLEELNDVVFGFFETEPAPFGVVRTVPGADHLTFAVFRSGFGDGVYGSWWGLDEADRPVCLLTDFHVVGFTDEADNAPPPWWKFWQR